ncbi:MAG: PQQ-dependent sugar dehydrogenase [Acidobacteriota bacterium]
MKLFLPTAFLVMVFTSTLYAKPKLDEVKLPQGFTIELYADVPDARSLALGARGTVFVGNREGDSVYAIEDRGAGQGRTVHVIARGLNMPNGVAFRDGDLYVAEVSRVLRLPGIESRLANPPRAEVVADGFPSDKHHGWKYIAFGPDGWLYVPVGAPCNVCERPDPYSTIMRLDVRNAKREVFARGIRNTVGFAWQPGTGTLWFTNNGRDWMGDESPPDSLHRAPEPGLNFGFPYCHAGVPDPKFGKDEDCASFAPPALTLPAHVAALGMAFYTGNMFPKAYQGQIFIAEHGSWNRSAKTGYRISLARFKEDGSLQYDVFATGWLNNRDAWGRPVDVLVMPDGALLVSDDKAGAVYRITYKAKP